MAVFTVTTTADSGAGSLRQAILDANAALSGPREVHFDLPGAGVHTIAPASPLPEVRSSLVIDAATQPGYAGTPLVELRGTGAGPGADGLVLAAQNSAVRGRAVNGFGNNGVAVTGDNVSITSNYIGLDAAGNTPRPNGAAGISVTGRSTLIGGPAAAHRKSFQATPDPASESPGRTAKGSPW
jgi:hypothetical protein